MMVLFIGAGLMGYFAPNLFWFDTQTTMLVLILLLGWVISLERSPGEAGVSVETSQRDATSSASGGPSSVPTPLSERRDLRDSQRRMREEPNVELFAAFLRRKLRDAFMKFSQILRQKPLRWKYLLL